MHAPACVICLDSISFHSVPTMHRFTKSSALSEFFGKIFSYLCRALLLKKT